MSTQVESTRPMKVHMRAQLEIPTSRVRGMTRDPLNRVSYQMGMRAVLALTAATEHISKRLLVEAHEHAMEENRERVSAVDLRRAIDKNPGLFKPVLGDNVVIGGGGVTVHFEPATKHRFRAAAASHSRVVLKRAARRAEDEDDEDDEDDEFSGKEGEEEESEEEESEEEVAPPARKTRRRAEAQKRAQAVSAAVKAKKAAKKKAAAAKKKKADAGAAAATGKKKKRPAPARSPRKQPAAKRARK